MKPPLSSISSGDTRAVPGELGRAADARWSGCVTLPLFSLKTTALKPLRDNFGGAAFIPDCATKQRESQFQSVHNRKFPNLAGHYFSSYLAKSASFMKA